MNPLLTLRDRYPGQVVLPADPAWDNARLAWNLAVDQHPMAVAFPESADDVAAIVSFAREHGLRVAPQGTGHGAASIDTLENAILLKTERMRGVEIDREARRARVEAGAWWADVTVPAAEHGLAALAGSSPDVGVVGYTLGGGIGWLARKHGTSANSVLAAEVVTADGRLVRADAENEPEVFWAIRGGGGSFGIVTALEIALYPIREVYAGALFWPQERAEEILNAWSEWVQDVPDEVTSVGRLLNFPPIPEIPEPLRGGSFVLVEAAFLTEQADADELLRPLRELDPAMDTFAVIPIPELSGLHMDPPEPVGGVGDGGLVDELPADAIAAFVAAAGPESGSALLSAEFRHLGGALARADTDAGSLASVDAPFVWFAVGLAGDAESIRATEESVRRVHDALAPWDAGLSYFNFTERPTGGEGLHPGETYDRLREIKAAVDPDELFLSNHPITPALAVTV